MSTLSRPRIRLQKFYDLCKDVYTGFKNFASSRDRKARRAAVALLSSFPGSRSSGSVTTQQNYVSETVNLEDLPGYAYVEDHMEGVLYYDEDEALSEDERAQLTEFNGSNAQHQVTEDVLRRGPDRSGKEEIMRVWNFGGIIIRRV
jgi:hypothetical protein